MSGLRGDCEMSRGSSQVRGRHPPPCFGLIRICNMAKRYASSHVETKFPGTRTQPTFSLRLRAISSHVVHTPQELTAAEHLTGPAVGECKYEHSSLYALQANPRVVKYTSHLVPRTAQDAYSATEDAISNHVWLCAYKLAVQIWTIQLGG